MDVKTKAKYYIAYRRHVLSSDGNPGVVVYAVACHAVTHKALSFFFR